MSRYHLHVAEQADGATRFQTQEAETEQEAASAASLLARRGFVVWLYEHDHTPTGGGAYREVGMFIGERFLATRRGDARAANGHDLR